MQAGLRTRHITTVAITTACRNATHSANLHAILWQLLLDLRFLDFVWSVCFDGIRDKTWFFKSINNLCRNNFISSYLFLSRTQKLVTVLQITTRVLKYQRMPALLSVGPQLCLVGGQSSTQFTWVSFGFAYRFVIDWIINFFARYF